MKKSLLWLLIVLLSVSMVATFSLAGCKEEAAKEEVVEEEVVEEEEIAEEETAAATIKLSGEVNIIHCVGFAEVAPMVENIPKFEAETGLKVNVIEADFQSLKQKYALDATFASGQYDIWTVWDGTYGLMGPYGIDLDEYILRDYGMTQEEYVDQFVEPLQKVMTYTGKIKFLPYFVAIQWGVYRKSLFEDPKEQKAFKEKYGYDLKLPETAQELIDVASFFTRDTNNDGEIDMWGLTIPLKGANGGSFFEDAFYRLGFDYFDENWKCNLGISPHKEDAIALAQLEYDLIHKYKVMSTSSVALAETDFPEFYLQGRSAMAYTWLKGVWPLFNSQEYIDKIGESGVWAFPSINGANAGGFFGFWGPEISKYSKNPEGAWALVKWIFNDENQKAMKMVSAAGPNLKSYEEWGAQEGIYDPGMLEAQEGSRCFPPIPEMEVCRNVIYVNHEKMLTGDMTPEEFVTQSATEIEKILEDAGYYYK